MAPRAHPGIAIVYFTHHTAIAMRSYGRDSYVVSPIPETADSLGL